MNIHEYQSKDLLRAADVSVPNGGVVESPQDVEGILNNLSSDRVVVKAQIHAGGRGKAGGVKVVPRVEAKATVRGLLGRPLVTRQTSPEGRIVKRVLIEEALPIVEEYYLSLLIDRSQKFITMMLGPGGVEVEDQDPSLIHSILIDPNEGASLESLEKLADSHNLSGLAPLLLKMYNLFIQNDCSLLEVNPLARLSDGRFVALDAKIILDDNALFRHPELEAFRDLDEEDPTETLARQAGLSFVKLDGSIGCMVNGAGLAMATMDLIALHGLRPANFLDVGGKSNADSIAGAMTLLLDDSAVKIIFVNIFGGIVRCDEVARGILMAVEKRSSHVPLVVRLTGTNEEEGHRLLASAGHSVLQSMDEAARRVFELASQNKGRA